MTNQICVVTGASSGIGLATALALAKQGGRIIMVSREPKRAEAAHRRVMKESGNAQVESWLADLSSQAEVRRVAGALLALPPIDVLVNNAGALYGRRRETADGREMTWALNHLTPFMLTLLLLDSLRAAPGARVLTTSSILAMRGRIDAGDLDARSSYSGMRAYAQAKLAQLLFVGELARRLGNDGVTVNAVHPGNVATRSAQNSAWPLRAIYAVIAPLFFLSPERGADSLVWAASSDELKGTTGRLFCKRQEMAPPPAALDTALAERVWAASEDATGVRWR
jgi:NAD(P)-dependent dehydrogenase (short-subunit alcohol dehydrogenase family)